MATGGRPAEEYSFSSTGFLDTTIYRNALRSFCDRWCLRESCSPDLGSSSLRALVFTDQLAAHKNEEICRECLARNVMLWWLPKNLSHVVQPLDEKAFAGAKQFFYKEVGSLQWDLRVTGLTDNLSLGEVLLISAREALCRMMTVAVVKASFRDTFLWPWDKEEYLEHVRREIGDLPLVSMD